MMHLLLGIPAGSIRLSPFITAVNHPPVMMAREVGVNAHPEASVDCLPGVASMSARTSPQECFHRDLTSPKTSHFFWMSAQMVKPCLATATGLSPAPARPARLSKARAWSTACGPPTGAIEEVWINNDTLEPTYRVIGGGKPKGICGSGLISLLSEAFLTGILDKAGNVNLSAPSSRVREGTHGGEYVVAWGAESEIGRRYRHLPR